MGVRLLPWQPLGSGQQFFRLEPDFLWLPGRSDMDSLLQQQKFSARVEEKKKSVYFCFGFKTRLRFLLEINVISRRSNERIRFSDKTLLGKDGGMN